MKRLFRWDWPSKKPDPNLILLFAFFLCGAIIACIVSASVDGESGEALTKTIVSYISVLSERPISTALLGPALLNAFRYHLLVFVFSFTSLGVLFVPCLMALRGFFLSFSITAFVRLFGTSGLWLALGAFLVQNLILLPCLFVLAQGALSSSLKLFQIAMGRLSKPATPLFGRPYFLRFAVISVFLVVCALYEAFLSPMLFTWIAGAVL